MREQKGRKVKLRDEDGSGLEIKQILHADDEEQRMAESRKELQHNGTDN